MIHKTTIASIALAAAGLLMSANASALTLTPGDADATSNDNSNCAPTCINTIFGTSFTDPDDLAYKDNVGGSEDGYLSGSYETTFSNTGTDPQDALIEYVSGDSLNCTAEDQCILVVKDGNQTPAQYFFDLFLAGWDGTEDLFLDGFWPNQGAISNVQIWAGEDGCCDPDEDVPAPATLALLGLGLLGFGATRRRRNAA